MESEATPGVHGFGFLLRLIFSENSKSSLINANGLMDFNWNLDTAVNYVPHKRSFMCFIYFPHHTLNACSLTAWNKILFLRIQCATDQQIYQANRDTRTPKTTSDFPETASANQNRERTKLGYSSFSHERGCACARVSQRSDVSCYW